MSERRVVVALATGLHARPAALFARLVAQQPVAVTIRKPGGAPVSAASVLGIMTLGAHRGDEVVLQADGDDGATVLAVLDVLAGFLQQADPVPTPAPDPGV